jgi:hypothetical protein
MKTEDRLVALIRAEVEEDLRGLTLPADLVQRVVARPPRRRRRWRVHFMVMGAATATAGVVALTSAVLPEPADQPKQPIAIRTASPTPFDPTRLLRFGNPPSGWTMVRTAQHPGGLQERTEPQDRTAHIRRWLVAYLPPTRTPRNQRPQRLQIWVATGRVKMASFRAGVSVDGPEKFSALPVKMGTAEYTLHASGGTGVQAIWQPRSGMVIVIQSNWLDKDQLFKVVNGISIAGP